MIYSWVKAFPMLMKSYAHEAFSPLFKRDGAPTTMAMDSSKEQTLGDFKKTCRQAGFHIREIETYSPSWMNSADITIKEVKFITGRYLHRCNYPLKLWDDCLERRACIRSFTAHDIFGLMG